MLQEGGGRGKVPDRQCIGESLFEMEWKVTLLRVSSMANPAMRSKIKPLPPPASFASRYREGTEPALERTVIAGGYGCSAS